jgi:bifunctional oligoribonuclease and PAP phosphatase NrnA
VTITDALSRAAEVLLGSEEVALACHINPDTDAVGSMLGLANHLSAQGKKVVCSFGNEPFEQPRWLSELPGTEHLVPPSEFPKAPKVLVTCDSASLDRLGALVGRVAKAGEVIWIDHHISNEGLGTVQVVDPTASSTCEIVYRLIEVMGGGLKADAAKCLYAGLVTDTGRFMYEAVRPSALRLAAELREFDFDHSRLAQALYEDNALAYLRLLGTVLGRLNLAPEVGLVWTSISQAEMAEAGVHPSDTDDLIDSVRTVREADVAAVIKQQRDGGWKVSTRSRGGHDLATIAARFGGGGHRLAAGYTSKLGLDETVLQLIEALREAEDPS